MGCVVVTLRRLSGGQASFLTFRGVVVAADGTGAWRANAADPLAATALPTGASTSVSITSTMTRTATEIGAGLAPVTDAAQMFSPFLLANVNYIPLLLEEYILEIPRGGEKRDLRDNRARVCII